MGSAGFGTCQRVPLHAAGSPSPLGLMLTVFAQQDDLHFPAHVSHPLAINSERLRPGSAGLASGLRTVTTPDFSR